jgi:hypothetical protein
MSRKYSLSSNPCDFQPLTKGPPMPRKPAAKKPAAKAKKPVAKKKAR